MLMQMQITWDAEVWRRSLAVCCVFRSTRLKARRGCAVRYPLPLHFFHHHSIPLWPESARLIFKKYQFGFCECEFVSYPFTEHYHLPKILSPHMEI